MAQNALDHSPLYFKVMEQIRKDILDKLNALLSRFLVWRLSGDNIPCLTLGLTLLVRTLEPSVPTMLNA